MSQENVYCCDQMAVKRRTETPEGVVFSIDCEVCGRHAESATPDGVVAAFQKSLQDADADPGLNAAFDGDPTPANPVKDVSPAAQAPVTRPDTQAQTTHDKPEETALTFPRGNIPKNGAELAAFFSKNLAQMTDIATPFIGQDRPALTRLIKNNIRHVVAIDSPAFKKCWSTQEGQRSIVYAIEEALALGAELGKMGSLVPFGGICEFIPAVEAFEFALTNGNTPPFKWIQIEMVHENDIKEIARINGEFSCKIKIGIPRGKLMSVIVYGHNTRLDHVIGEVYDVDRLLEKAKIHSSSYKYYLRDLGAFEMARTEGRVQFDTSGREYAEIKVDKGEDKYADQNREAFEKAEAADKLKKDSKGDYCENVLPKKDGGTWTKKIYRSEVEDGFELKRVYRDELSNPYEGADQPEMLRKAAGKSFLGKYVRVRNAEAAIEESQGGEDAADIAGEALDAAFDSAQPVE